MNVARLFGGTDRGNHPVRCTGLACGTTLGSRIRRWVASLGLGLVLLTACTPHRSVEFRPVGDEPFPPRDRPAEISVDPEAAISARGYVRIGWVSVRHEVRVCFEDGTCATRIHPTNPASEARRVAAEHGGDLLRVAAIERIERQPLRRVGRCRVKMVNPQAEIQRALLLPRDICIEREWIRGVKETVVSEGSVWRLGAGSNESGGTVAANRLRLVPASIHLCCEER